VVLWIILLSIKSLEGKMIVKLFLESWIGFSLLLQTLLPGMFFRMVWLAVWYYRH
jgi:hypothetical protein